MLLIAGPLYCLYEICILLAWYLNRRDRQLYPEYYKDQDADEKAMAEAPEWDNESYNPWSSDGDDEEEKPAPRIPPMLGDQPMSDAHAVVESEPTAEPSRGDHAFRCPAVHSLDRGGSRATHRSRFFHGQTFHPLDGRACAIALGHPGA